MAIAVSQSPLRAGPAHQAAGLGCIKSKVRTRLLAAVAAAAAAMEAAAAAQRRQQQQAVCCLHTMATG